MYPDRKQRSFAARYPESWRAVSASDQGVTRASDAWLRFQRVYPLRGDAAVPADEGLAVPVATESYHWTVVSRLTDNALSLADGRLVPKLAASYGVAAFLAFWAAWALSLVTLRGRALSQAMETVLDNVPVLISYVDAEQRYRFNNRAYRGMWGVSPAEAYGRTLREVLGEETYAAVRPHVEQALAGEPVTYEARLDFRGAGRRDVTISYVPDVGESGDVRGFFAVVSDVSAVKEGERRDREHLNELAHAGRLASVGEMATQVAHEVNQPLTAIAAYAAACLQTLGTGGDPPPALKGWLEAIEGEARRASDVIRRLRDFVRKGETRFGALDVNAVVHEVVGMVQGDARGRGVSLTLDLAPGLGLVRADRILVEQVLLNLLRNALDVLGETPPKRRHLNVSTRPAGGAVEVAVSDTGPGVPEAFRAQLFERFFTSKPGGLGMGLPISRSIVEAHGGSIRYHDHPEGGAVFRFQLPLAA
jgi:PAS domain S-box-containing protein